MSDEKIQMPGDPDGYAEKIKQQDKEETTAPGEPRKTAKSAKSEAKAKDARKMDGEPGAAPEGKRGELSPAQHDDDGWGDTPVQMRG